MDINLSPEQWKLNTAVHGRVVLDKVADTLNKRVTLVYNSGDNVATLRAGFSGLLTDFALYTTRDTMNVFEQLAKEIYRGHR